MTETKHSPEPWRADEDMGLFDANGREVWLLDDIDSADLVRIVACVNACAGIPTEALEHGHLRAALDAARGTWASTNSKWRDAVTRLYAALEALGMAPVDAQEPHGGVIGRPGGQEGG